jgi:hypothetical protein
MGRGLSPIVQETELNASVDYNSMASY